MTDLSVDVDAIERIVIAALERDQATFRYELASAALPSMVSFRLRRIADEVERSEVGLEDLLDEAYENGYDDGVDAAAEAARDAPSANRPYRRDGKVA